jgi:hypothetical protein
MYHRFAINMGNCVGKPTLRLRSKSLPKVVDVDRSAGPQAGDFPGERERMAGADHRRDGLFALLRIGNRQSVGADPAPLGESERGGERLGVGMAARFGRVFLADPGNAQFLSQPPFAIASSRKPLGFGERERGIVDIAELGKAVRELLEIGLASAFPAPLTELPGEI